jgi:hypothetical protein
MENDAMKKIAVTVLVLAIASTAVYRAQPSSAPELTALDYIQIQQLVSSYAYALDSGADNGYMYADLFAPDGEFIVPYTKGRDALAELARTTAGARGGPDRVWHFLMNHIIEPSPEGATGKQYAAIINVGENGEPSAIQLGGHYEDIYVKTGDGWRFKRREFVPSRSGPRPAAAPSGQ